MASPDEKSGARLIPFEPGMVERIANGVRNMLGGGGSRPQVPSVTSRREPWFGPGEPLAPVAPKRDTAGRAFDYPTTWNLQQRPRDYSGISFEQLRGLADGFDLVRLAIETRKDQMAKLEWSILPKKRADQSIRAKPDERCEEIERFLAYPDRKHPWEAWVRLILEDQLVIDAPSIYVRRTLDNGIYALEVIDGSLIKPLLDETGRAPDPPTAAYQQVLKGMVACEYTTDELVYWPRNLRPHRAYGNSPVEQIILTVNIAIRRELSKLEYYTVGNVPEALVGVPKEWSPQQIQYFQEMWDAMLSNPSVKRRMYFVPGDMNFQPTRSDTALMETYDEWLARVICYAFSLPPLPFVRQFNRATAQTSYDSALEEGLQPMMVWFKGLMDHFIQKVFGYTDLEFVWDEIRKVDPAEQESRNLQLMRVGIKSIDEIRAEMGLEPLGMKHVIFGVGPMGLMFVEDILKARAQGLMMPQAQMPPDMYGGMGADPMMSGQPQNANPGILPSEAAAMAPQALDALQGVPPALLSAVGLGGSEGREVNVTEEDEDEDDPVTPMAAHPEVVHALRDAEKALGRRS